MSNDIQPAQREQTLSQYIAAALHAPTTRSQVASGFAPWLDVDQFAGQCAIVASDAAMQGADRASLLKALLKLGQYGLIPGPARHASLIVDRGGQVQVRPEFRGWQYVWAVAGWEVSAHLVVKGDDLVVESIGPDEFWVTKHSYDPLAERPITDKTLRGGYVRGVHKATGETRYRFVTLAKILANKAKAQTQTIWSAHFAEMAQKTLIHVAASRGWFPTPAHVAMALNSMADADHEAAGVALDKGRPTRGERVAGNIVTLRTPASLPKPDAQETPETAPEAAEVPQAVNDPSEPAGGAYGADLTHCPRCGVVVEAELAQAVLAKGNCPACAKAV